MRTEEFDDKYPVPDNYYVTLRSKCHNFIEGGWENFHASDVKHPGGHCMVEVYRSMDREISPETGNLEHAVLVGSFRVVDTKKMDADKFLEAVRKGVCELIE